jgi:hypothetical protein
MLAELPLTSQCCIDLCGVLKGEVKKDRGRRWITVSGVLRKIAQD